jgi:thiosulfate/3-mercaptopyruvate sulfurtransferase
MIHQGWPRNRRSYFLIQKIDKIEEKGGSMMRKMRWLKALLVLALLFLPLTAMARDMNPIVSTDWLQGNLANPKLVIVDLRKVEDYKAGHIPGAVNVFYGSWAIKKGALLNELPPLDDLADVIGGAGIGKDSWVVLVGKTEKIPDQFDMTRVAWTLKYAGVENAAILNGGQDQWVKEKKPLSQEMVKAKAKPYKAEWNKNLFVDKAFVLGKLGKATIVDTRGPAFFAGKEKLAFVAKTGRIKGSVNLPVGLLYTKEGLYKDKAELASLATKAVGDDMNKEVILYCDTGKTCTSWAFMMTDLLGYKDVKIYDGSFMEWAAEPNVPMEP